MACTSVHIHDTAIDFLMHEEARPYTVWFTYGYAIYGANARAQPLPEAGATQERTLEAVGCSALFGNLRPTRILGLAG